MKKLKSLLVLFLLFNIVLAFGQERHTGLCLAGGGSKSAYQVGVWQYLVENKINNEIKAISSTGVSSFNAMLFATKSESEINTIWQDTFSDGIVLSLDMGFGGMLTNATDEFAKTIGQLYEANKSNVNNKSELILKTTKDGATIGAMTISSFIKDSFWKYLGTEDKVEGLYDRAEFTSIINKNVDINAIQKSDMEVYVNTICKENLAVKSVSKFLSVDTTANFPLSLQPDNDTISNIILAASATPFAFTTVTINENAKTWSNGKITNPKKPREYFDGSFEIVGGSTYNIQPLQKDTDIYKIIVVYLASEKELGNTRLKSDKINKKLIEIIPSVDLNGFVNKNHVISKSNILKLIELGYNDAKAIFENQ